MKKRLVKYYGNNTDKKRAEHFFKLQYKNKQFKLFSKTKILFYKKKFLFAKTNRNFLKTIYLYYSIIKAR